MNVDIGTVTGTIELKDEFASVLSAARRELDAFKGDIASVERAVSDTSFGSAARSLGSFGDSAQMVGLAMLPMSAAVSGLGGAALKLATDFESSFAGVRKTVDATEPELAALAHGFRGLSREIPLSVHEINRIGEAAGQLGIKTENILGFTRVMADLGVTTNLTSDAAATALARLANITQMPQENFDRLGSTIVQLGNKLATTEAEITEFGLRIAGAGSQIGLSEAEILSFGAALSSVGIRAEAGGTAISKVMIDIAASVDQGGARLEQFAEVAMGTAGSAKQFAQLFREDAAQAVTAFVVGLGSMEAQGKSTLGVLAEMDIKETRMRDALLRASGAGDLLAESIRLGNAAWEENTALTKEAEQRYATTASQLTLLWNELKDVGLTLGQVLLPVFKSFLDLVRSAVPLLEAAVRWFSGLSPGIQQAGVAVGGLVAAMGPMLLVFGSMASAVSALLPMLPALGTAFAALATGPIGIMVGALAGLSLAWITWGDDVTRVVSDTFGAVKQWLVDAWEGSIFQSFARMLEAMGRLVGALAMVAVQKAMELYTGVKLWVLDSLQPVFAAAQAFIEPFIAFWDMAKERIIGAASSLYHGVKSWLVDKFAAIVDGVKAKIDAVTGFFNDMYEKVVGSSYVPDMVEGIGREMGRLGDLMVKPAEDATRQTTAAFDRMATEQRGTMATMMESTNTMSTTVKGVFSALGNKFKGFAIAEAVISTYLSIAKSLATLPWPANLVAAAGAAAVGFANVAKIRSADTPSFALGTPNLDTQNFGRGTWAMLHGEEAVVPKARIPDFVARHGGDANENGVALAIGRLEAAIDRNNRDLPFVLTTALKSALATAG